MTPARLHLGFSDTHAAPALPAASHDLPDLLRGRPCDPRMFRALYPTKWAAFLRAHFENPTHVAAFFDVDHHCARNWYEGKTGPQGWAVNFALRAVPDAQPDLEAE